MIRYLPPNGTAGFARTEDRIDSRSPSPPARITAMTGFTKRRPSVAALRASAPTMLAPTVAAAIAAAVNAG